MSKFDDIFSAAKKSEAEPKLESRTKTKSKPKPEPELEFVEPELPTKKMGRPRAKKSDPSFTQISAYIRRDTLKRVKIKLLDLDEGDMSELVEQLFQEWLKTN